MNEMLKVSIREVSDYVSFLVWDIRIVKILLFITVRNKDARDALQYASGFVKA